MNRQWQFEVGAPLVGYTKTTTQGWNARRARYVRWKHKVRGIACEAGVPLKLDKTIHYEVRCDISWKRAARIDTSSIHKGVEDALWGKDRMVLSVHADAGEGTGREAVRVIVTERWVRKHLSTTGGRGKGERRENGGTRRAPSPDPYSREFRSRLT